MAELNQFRPGLWLVECQLEDFQVRGAAIVGREHLLVWDSLPRPGDMAGVAELAPTLPIIVVYSHADWDHVLGTSGLTRTPTEIIGHPLSLQRFSQELPRDLEERRRVDPVAYREARIIPPSRTPGQSLANPEGLRIDLGGVEVELHHLPGHTPDSLVCHIPEWGVFLGGDAVEYPFPFLNPGCPIRDWSDALYRWAGKLEATQKPSLVIPSHGRVGGAELLRENAGYLDALLAGEEPDLRGNPTPFYAETHTNNVAIARGE